MWYEMRPMCETFGIQNPVSMVKFWMPLVKEVVVANSVFDDDDLGIENFGGWWCVVSDVKVGLNIFPHAKPVSSHSNCAPLKAEDCKSNEDASKDVGNFALVWVFHTGCSVE